MSYPEMEKFATEITTKWGDTVYPNIGIAYYTHFYYDNLTDFNSAFYFGKENGLDVTGNLNQYRICLKERKTLEEYVDMVGEQE